MTFSSLSPFIKEKQSNNIKICFARNKIWQSYLNYFINRSLKFQNLEKKDILLNIFGVKIKLSAIKSPVGLFGRIIFVDGRHRLLQFRLNLKLCNSAIRLQRLWFLNIEILMLIKDTILSQFLNALLKMLSTSNFEICNYTEYT